VKKSRGSPGALPTQDGHLVSQGDEFELQGEATTNPEREQRTEGGQKLDHADDGMTASRKTLCFLGHLEFLSKDRVTSSIQGTCEGGSDKSPSMLGRAQAVGKTIDVVVDCNCRLGGMLSAKCGDSRVAGSHAKFSSERSGET